MKFLIIQTKPLILFQWKGIRVSFYLRLISSAGTCNQKNQADLICAACHNVRNRTRQINEPKGDLAFIVESTFGDRHPGSGHLDTLINAAVEGIAESGDHGARYFTTDMCDGESQGNDDINFSLISSDRELSKTIALITDGLFSGVSTGPVIGHCSPEAQGEPDTKTTEISHRFTSSLFRTGCISHEGGIPVI